MHASSRLIAIAATFSSALAAFQGFNYGSTFNSGAPKSQSDFEAEFKAAQGLVGAPGSGFTSARLYTTVQAGTNNGPISAIPAAISTKTSLLLGVWCSAGDGVVDDELQALKSAISRYGTQFGNLVAGISVGSEDLYRNSPTGILNKENPGKNPSDIARYIKQVRDAIAGTPLEKAPVGHVDTWTAWVNGSNQAVIDASDWIGIDAYPYFQETQTNSIANSKSLFSAAFDATKAAVGGKPVWVTETGFPVSGKTVGLAVPGLENAKTYWDEVGCPLFGITNVWWYTFQDAAPATPNPSFGVIGSSLTTTPLYDISCKNVNIPSGSSGVPSTPSSQGSSGSTSLPTGVVNGNSPGAGSGLGSSQLPLESSILSNTAGRPTTTVAVGSGPGSNSTVAPTTGTPRPLVTPNTNPNGAVAASGPIGAAFAAVMVAILAL